MTKNNILPALSDNELLKFTIKQHGNTDDIYDVELARNCTIEEFLQIITSNRKEWGTIRIFRMYMLMPQELGFIEYEHGTIKTNTICSEYLGREIKQISAHGGWSMMNYNINIDPPNPVPKKPIVKYDSIMKI